MSTFTRSTSKGDHTKFLCPVLLVTKGDLTCYFVVFGKVNRYNVTKSNLARYWLV